MLKECPSCHSLFITPNNHKYCKFCYKKFERRRAEEQQKNEDARWLQQKAIEKVQFKNALGSWNVVKIDEILSIVDKPMYVIGNGFDLLHGAKTSYYNFRDSLGKRSQLLWCLETYLNTENVWGNFEEALGHLNVKTIANTDIVDMWLDNFEVYDEDFSYANFFAATEAAASPALTIANDLPRLFRKWIESVVVPTHDRPLINLIKNAPVLNFNYTEFIETLYGVDHDNICYIHGCRKKIKGKPKEKLILGHLPGANDKEYYFHDKWKPKNSYRRHLIEIGKEKALEYISNCDNELTKHCQEIIKDHQNFFDKLDITDVITIGHSLSDVDWNYFEEIIKDNHNDLNWYISCHGLNDLKNIEKFMNNFSINPNKVHLFNLSDIKITIDIVQVDKKVPVLNERFLCEKDGCIIQELQGRLNIYENGEKCYSVILPGFIRKAILFDNYLLVVCEDTYFFRFEKANDTNVWKFINILEPIQNQYLFNKRLNRLLQDDNTLAFVYNNRIRKYSLEDGSLIENIAIRNARELYVRGKMVEF